MNIITNLLILLINLGVLALTVKLYTEILKDKSQDQRSKTKQGDSNG